MSTGGTDFTDRWKAAPFVRTVRSGLAVSFRFFPEDSSRLSGVAGEENAFNQRLAGDVCFYAEKNVSWSTIIKRFPSPFYTQTLINHVSYHSYNLVTPICHISRTTQLSILSSVLFLFFQTT